MTDREKIIKAFEDITPSEKIINNILNIQPRKVKKHRMRKIAVPALCACLILSIGAATVTAVNKLDFNDIFGNYIKLDDSELSDKIIGTISNVRYSVSDNDFKLSVKGTASSDSLIIAVIEISHKDGKPMTEHFEIPLNEEKIRLGWFESYIKTAFEEYLCDTGTAAYINDEGNIELMLRYHIRNPQSCTLKAEGHNLYPDQAYNDFLIEKNVRYDRYEHFKGYADCDTDWKKVKPVNIDDSIVRLLSLDWKIKFDFTSSGENDSAKECKDFPEEFAVYYTNNNEIREITGKPYLCKAGAMGAKLKFYFNSDHISWNIINCEQNEFYIIKSDGTYIPMTIEGCMGGSTLSPEFEHEYDIDFMYCDDIGNPVLLNIDDIKAISINGTALELQ